jgi:hypothetical protein
MSSVKEINDGVWYVAEVTGVIKDTHLWYTYIALLGRDCYVRRNAHKRTYYQVIAYTLMGQRRAFYVKEADAMEGLNVLTEAGGGIDSEWKQHFHGMRYDVGKL